MLLVIWGVRDQVNVTWEQCSHWGGPLGCSSREILSWMWLQGRYVWPMCQCWSGYRYVAISGPRAGLSSGVTTIRGHTQPGSPPSVRCQVVTIARQRQYTHEHMSREHGHNCVAKFFSKDSKYQLITLSQAGDLTRLTEEEWVCWDVGMKTVFLDSFYCRDLFSVYCW